MMKKTIYLIAMMMGLISFTSCSSDRDSNPELKQPKDFKMNIPALAGNTYDLANSEYVAFSCSQPDYGYTAPVTYAVQLSLTEDMDNAQVLPTVFNTVNIQADAKEMSVAVTQLLVDDGHTEADFPMETPVYVRLHAQLAEGVGEVLSNVVKLERVKTAFSLPPVLLPENVYMIGNFCGWNWDNSFTMVGVNGANDTFWHMVYIDSEKADGMGIKISTTQAWDGHDYGFGKLEIEDKAGAGVEDNGGNIVVSKAGWYLAVVTAQVEGRDVKFKLTLQKPEVYTMGPVSGGWDECNPAALFTVPETKDGQFVSPAFVEGVNGDPGVRAYVKIAPYDWWKAEFMVFDGEIKYRGRGGDQERVSAEAGQKLYLDFNNETGEIK